MNDREKLVPKVPGGPLRVLMIGRISTPHQDLGSIEAGYRDVREHLAHIYEGDIHIKELGGRGSGMRTDRASIMEAADEIATGTWDLAITIDLGRFYRNPRHLYIFIQDAVDHRTRVIAISDGFDTANPDWQMRMGIAAIHHGMTIPDTQRRVRSKAREDFHKGGMVMKVHYGYSKLTREEAVSRSGPDGLRLARRPECTATIMEMRRRVLDGEPYAATADWLNDAQVEVGPYVKSGVWTARLVASLLRDPILSGTRTFRTMHSSLTFSDGKSRREKNPDGPMTAFYPELAHMTADEHRELATFMETRALRNRHAVGRDHPLYNKPRNRALWPAQHPRCGVCGELMYRYEAGDLKCRSNFVAKKSGGDEAANPRCWNHLQVDGREIRTRVLQRVIEVCEKTPHFRTTLIDAAWEELQAQAMRSDRSGHCDEEQVAELERRGQRVAQAISKGGELEVLLRQAAEIDAQLQTAKRQFEARRTRAATPRLASREDVERCLEKALVDVAGTSYEFAAFMRRVIPTFTIVPVQALDTGLVRPRGKLVLDLSTLGQGGHGKTDDGETTTVFEDRVAMTIDLFEPPAHIRAIDACLEARRSITRPTLARIAEATGIHRMTVKRALDYAKRMEAEGLEDPYRELTECPAAASRWRNVAS